jgi:hypothetical protein
MVYSFRGWREPNATQTRQRGSPRSLDHDQVRDFAHSYTEAWCSHETGPGGNREVGSDHGLRGVDVRRVRPRRRGARPLRPGGVRPTSSTAHADIDGRLAYRPDTPADPRCLSTRSAASNPARLATRSLVLLRRPRRGERPRSWRQGSPACGQPERKGPAFAAPRQAGATRFPRIDEERQSPVQLTCVSLLPSADPSSTSRN